MKIKQFQGEYRFLSNFWPAKVFLDGVEYPTVEHAYMAAKTEDIEIRQQILSMTKPGDVKRFMRGVPLRTNWHSLKVKIMKNLVEQKFQDPILKQKLLSTGDAHIEEGNTWGDCFWGVCNGKGENQLGKILMEVRQHLNDENSHPE